MRSDHLGGMERSELIREIERFCADAGWTEATFGTYANKDRGFVDRLRRGDVTHRISERVAEFMRAQRANLAKRKEAAK